MEFVYDFAWGIGHNVVLGYHPVWRATIYTIDDAQRLTVVRDLNTYFGRGSRSSSSAHTQQDLNQTRSAILEQMARQKARYGNSPVLELMKMIAEHAAWQDRMIRSYHSSDE